MDQNYRYNYLLLILKKQGSTCALTESILRACGLKTGFFSSPHLIDETERIQLFGKPISKDKFAKYFWKVYDLLDNSRVTNIAIFQRIFMYIDIGYLFQDHEKDMPAYFKFLTVMAFHVFLEEQVDVAIIEVGIGGEHDCTNIIP